MLSFSHWLRPPRHVLTLFLGVTGSLLLAMGWLAWQLVSQDRALAAQRTQERLDIATPNLPDEAEYPRKLYILTTAFIIATIVYGIARLIIAMIREHREDAF